MSIDSSVEGWAKDRRHFNMFFDGMMDGFAYFQILVDAAGKPVDFVFLEVNNAFERIMGSKREKIIGKKVTEVIKGIENDPADWIGRFGKIALGCESAQFESYSESLGKWFTVSAYCPEKDYFVAIFEDITERKKAHEALQKNEEHLRSVLTNSPDVVYRFNLQTGRNEYMSPACKPMLGYAPEALMAMTGKEVLSHVYPDDLLGLQESLKCLKKIGKGVAEYRFKRKDGSYVWLSDQMVISTDQDGKPLYRDGFVRNITDKKKAEENLLKLNRTLRAISNSNQALLRSTDEKSFLEQACKIIVEDCGYKMVWVGLAENDEAKTVRPAAYAGFDEGYIESLKITWADIARGQGPTGRAIRTGKIQFCKNMQADPKFKPWAEEALKRGFVSSIALPLVSGKKVLGALMLYSAEQNVNSKDEIKLLNELASDFAHGINMLRLRREKEIAEAQIQRQANLIDLSPDAIIVRTVNGTITFWNKGAEKLYGWTKKEAIGKTTSELFQTKYPQPFQEIVAELKRAKRWTGELTHKTKSGDEVVVQSWWLAERTEHGKIKSILESNVDLTERKRSEEAIAWLASFPTLNPSPIIEVDTSGKITYVNPATDLLFPNLRKSGISHPFLIGFKNVVKIFDDYSKNTIGREIKIRGRWFHQQFYLVPQSQKVRIYATDINDLKKSEEARIKAQEKLEENAVLLEEYASRMEQLAEQRAQQLKDAERLAAIGQTASMVGHDIRNPLQAITGDIYLIAEEARVLPQNDNTKAILDSVESVNENLTYINKIVSDLQDYTRPLRPTFQDADLADIIHGTILSVNIPKHIDVIVNMDANAKKIKTDAAYIRRALTNLFNNAVQAMPTAGKLTVYVTKTKRTTVITVEDTGVGIPQEAQEKLFTPLFTTKAKGQGLGLSVVKRLVEALGGVIVFKSKENNGTQFIITLPPQKSAD